MKLFPVLTLPEGVKKFPKASPPSPSPVKGKGYFFYFKMFPSLFAGEGGLRDEYVNFFIPSSSERGGGDAFPSFKPYVYLGIRFSGIFNPSSL
jgi:hypothetical protein